jgi:hypothetical protein
MKNLLRLILLSNLLILSITIAVISSANEPKPETPADNACYAGGLMEYKCDTDWEWNCGWYLARWITAGGWSGKFVMPTECLILTLLQQDDPNFQPTPTPIPTLTPLPL